MTEGFGKTALRFLLWCLLYCAVAVVGKADGIPHIFPFRAEGCRACRGNVKLSPASPMILHLLASPTSLHLGKESELSLRSTSGTPMEK